MFLVFFYGFTCMKMIATCIKLCYNKIQTKAICVEMR